MWRLVVPAHLAYGQQGAGDAIKPGSTLVFRLALVKVFDNYTVRTYPGSAILETVLLGLRQANCLLTLAQIHRCAVCCWCRPLPQMGYFCVRLWMVLFGYHRALLGRYA